VFIDDEVFFSLLGELQPESLQAGTGVRLHPRTQLDLYYLQKNLGSGAATYVLGTTFKVSPHAPYLTILPVVNAGFNSFFGPRTLGLSKHLILKLYD
jgi:hypothetical protein